MSERVAIVTGAGGELGRAAAARLAAAGYAVTGIDRNEQGLKELPDGIGRHTPPSPPAVPRPLPPTGPPAPAAPPGGTRPPPRPPPQPPPPPGQGGGRPRLRRLSRPLSYVRKGRLCHPRQRHPVRARTADR